MIRIRVENWLDAKLLTIGARREPARSMVAAKFYLKASMEWSRLFESDVGGRTVSRAEEIRNRDVIRVRAR